MALVVVGPRPQDHFTMVPNEIGRDRRLSYRARGIFTVLIGLPAGARISAADLADESEKEGRKAVLTALAELRDYGLLRTVRHREGREWRTTTYVRRSLDAPWPPMPKGAVDISAGRGEADLGTPGESEPADPRGECPQGTPVDGTPNSRHPDTGPYLEEPLVEEREEEDLLRAAAPRCEGSDQLALVPSPTPAPKHEYPGQFEDTWAVYPRKIAKKAAFKAWNARRRAGVPTAELHQAVLNFADECVAHGREQRHIMHGSTFFGPDERWKDYLDGPATPAPAPAPRTPAGGRRRFDPVGAAEETRARLRAMAAAQSDTLRTSGNTLGKELPA